MLPDVFSDVLVTTLLSLLLSIWKNIYLWHLPTPNSCPSTLGLVCVEIGRLFYHVLC